jgi:hypothetical protein
MLFLQNRTAVGALALVACCASPFAGASATERVPFVGCPSFGQVGPIAAPKGAPKSVAVDAATARQLAYYQAQDSFGVLAPRGWACLYSYGSNGATLMVAPSLDPQSALDAPLNGPAVVATQDSGMTSGRFDVARYSARLFAKSERAFIAGVIAEGIESKEKFPFGPYPADKTTYKSARLVEFETPANMDGLGTSDRLQKNSLPIEGMASLEGPPDGPDFFLLTVRLPAEQANLAPAIVKQAE